MLFGEKILDYWDDIIADLERLVAIPSVAKPTEGIHPYGEECARALDTALSLAEGYGLKTKNVGYYAGHAEYGEGEGNAVVMAHLDVVPAGEGWDTDPFKMVIKDGKAYGRGVDDDKGAAVVALHCLRAIKDAGIEGKRKLRVVFGCGEEIGMQDIPHYFEEEQLPDMGFTPDSGYGICHCEKGVINFTVSGKNDSEVIRGFSAGTVSNAVPAKASCEIVCKPEELENLREEAEKRSLTLQIERTESGARLTAEGKAGHAAFPQGGKNAISHLVKLLYDVFGAERLGKFFSFTAEKIGLSTDGSGLGIDCEDEESGALTFNLGLMSADSESCQLTVDIRYPATLSGGPISGKIRSEAESRGLEYTLLSDLVPLYLPKESKLITILSGAYRDVMGEDCNIFSMGGGTYARQMHGRGVAFGPGFGEATHAHDKNEVLNLESLKLHAKICLEAMYRMFTSD